MARGLRDRLFASWLYDLSLGNSASMPDGRPPPIWPASISKNAPEASFEWLSGLSDSNAQLRADQARERVGNWLANNLKWGVDNKIYGATSHSGGNIRPANDPQAATVSISESLILRMVSLRFFLMIPCN